MELTQRVINPLLILLNPGAFDYEVYDYNAKSCLGQLGSNVDIESNWNQGTSAVGNFEYIADVPTLMRLGGFCQ